MKKWLGAVLAVALLCSVFLAACSKESGKQTQNESSETNQTAVGPLGKYDPPIEVSGALGLAGSDLQFAKGDSYEDNVWTRMLLDEYGIKLNVVWGGGADVEKVNLAMASNSLPDIFGVNDEQLEKLIQAGKLEDLTQAFEQYATPQLKSALTADGGAALDATKRDGKLYAIPYLTDKIMDTTLMYVRSDWLTKLNLPEPKTMQDVLKISEAFTNQDPDGNGKPDTMGISWYDLFRAPLWNTFHAYPKAWVKDSSGALVYGSIQPEMKTALQTLQQLYQKGEIDKEFAVKKDKITENFANNKAGILFAEWWAPEWPLQDGKNNDPESEWKAYPLPSIDNDPAKVQVKGNRVTMYFVQLKGLKHPETIVQLANIEMVKTNGKDAVNYDTPESGRTFTYKSSPVITIPMRSSYDIREQIVEALETKDESNLTPEAKRYYDYVKAYLDGDISYWGHYMEFTKDGTLSFAEDLEKKGLYMVDEFTGIPTETMLNMKSILDSKFEETATQIIMGADISKFDAFVAEWKSQGGDQMTKEVNEWYKNKQ